MANLRREPGPFFFFLLASSLITMSMSMVFRTIGASSRSLAQAMAPGSVIILGLIMYSGFAIPRPYLRGWSRWIFHIDPLSYGFESLMANEFSGRLFDCTQYVPTGNGYVSSTGQQRVCSAVGSRPGVGVVLGDDYILSAFEYKSSHKWR